MGILSYKRLWKTEAQITSLCHHKVRAATKTSPFSRWRPMRGRKAEGDRVFVGTLARVREQQL